MKTIAYLYEDDDILVCVKPAGMATEGSQLGCMDLVSALKTHLVRERKKYCRQNSEIVRANTSQPYLALIHRLDKPVEGILVFGKNKKAAADLTRQLQSHKMQKDYLAVVVGTLQQTEGKCTDYLLRDHESGEVTIAGENIPQAQKAELTYQVIAQNTLPGKTDAAGIETVLSLVQIHLLTGRFHQIRAQMEHLGTPILGDHRFGDEKARLLAKEIGEDMVALCSYRLGFRHPVTHKEVVYQITPSGVSFRMFQDRMQAEGVKA